MSYQVLFVDDDENLLKSFTRSLSEQFKIVTAVGPEEGLRVLVEHGPVAVIVSDMKMPGMNGLEFLSRARKISPDTIHILLTGYADLQTAMDAVNKGGLFRLLTKPCVIDTLSVALQDGLRQYRLIVAEKELLEQTLVGTVKVLSQILTLVNPTAQGVTNSLKKYCRHIIQKLGLKEQWLFDMAVMLSQLGSLTIPMEVMNKYFAGGVMTSEELMMIKELPVSTVKLLMHIPRLEEVVEIISQQNNPYSQFPEYSTPEEYSKIHLGAQMLHVAISLECMLMAGILPDKALRLMGDDKKEFNPVLIATLDSYDFALQNMVRMMVSCKDLHTKMILDENIYSKKGMLLASNGQWVTLPVMLGLLNFSRSVGVKEPFAVIVPILDYEEVQL